MHIVVLGASSTVGAALAAAFSPGNSLVLVGRNGEKLEAAAAACRGAGALEARCVTADFSQDIGPLLSVLEGQQVDLIVDAASAASGARDADIKPGQFETYVAADVQSKIRILEHVLGRQPKAPAVVFISSVLALAKSPGRVVYTSLKQLYEVYLRRTRESRPDFRLLIVYVGTVLDTTRASKKADRLARSVTRAFDGGRRAMFFGLIGLVFLGLYFLQPILFLFVTFAQRRLRRLFR